MYVGSLTVPLHQEWTDAALSYQKQHYPNMRLVTDAATSGRVGLNRRQCVAHAPRPCRQGICGQAFSQPAS